MERSYRIFKYYFLFLFVCPLGCNAQLINVNYFVNLNTADSLYEQGKYSACIPFYEKVIGHSNVYHNHTYYNLSYCYVTTGNTKRAGKVLMQGIDNGLYYSDTAYCRTDTNLFRIFEKMNSSKRATYRERFLNNSLTYSVRYADTLRYASVRRELLERKKKDQLYRGTGQKKDSLWKLQKEIDGDNERYLKQVLDSMNWPNVLIAGKMTSVAVLIAQHADEDIAFQKLCLDRMAKELKYKTIRISDFAYLYDRIQLAEGKKQIFGTQVDWMNDGDRLKAIARPLLYPELVNLLRSYFDLPDLERYLNDMTMLERKRR